MFVKNRWYANLRVKRVSTDILENLQDYEGEGLRSSQIHVTSQRGVHLLMRPTTYPVPDPAIWNTNDRRLCPRVGVL